MFFKMLTCQFLQKSIIRVGKKITTKNCHKKTLLHYNFQLHQNNRIVNPQTIIIKNKKTFY